MALYYPAFLDVKGRLCVVVGGGEVAERKIASLLECGARVRVVSPEATEAVQRSAEAGTLSWERREYLEGDLEGAFLAIAATDDRSVNSTIAQEAERKKVLLNVVDVTSLCSFVAPSVVRRGEVVLAISTGGLSPALARKLREELEKSTALEYADLATLLSEVRLELREEGARVAPDHWQACLNEEVLALYRKDKRAAKERLKESLLWSAR